MVMLSFSDRVEVPKHVLVRFLEKESVFLNLETEQYYGLDETGTRMWQAVTAASSLEAAQSVNTLLTGSPFFLDINSVSPGRK